MVRCFPSSAVIALATASLVLLLGCSTGSTEEGSWIEIEPADPTYELSDDEWRQRLTDDEYHILREEGTEPAFSGELLGNERDGIYTCAGCGQELFSSATRFDSGTGWPSYTEPIDDDTVGTREDMSTGQMRVEVHCGKCSGHLGHVFPDGPEPTGLRYCINSLAMDFEENP